MLTTCLKRLLTNEPILQGVSIIGLLICVADLYLVMIRIMMTKQVDFRGTQDFQILEAVGYCVR